MASSPPDLISALPDVVLNIIVSSLPYEEAARTSILSTRWRHLNTRTTGYVVLNERFFVKHVESEENKAQQRRMFIDFVQQWIANFQEPIINMFSLTVSNPESVRAVIDSCIDFALSHNVRELGFDFSNPMWNENDGDQTHAALFDLPSHVYEHGILESLELTSCNFRVLEFEKFSLLKDLSLGWVELSTNSLHSLLVTCRTLESLSLKKCWNVDYIDIGGPDLRLSRLVIDKCHFHQNSFNIEAPNLRYFKYCGIVGIFNIEVTRLIMKEADLNFGIQADWDHEMYTDFEAGSFLYKLLDDLYTVRIMTVCNYMLQVIPCGEEPLSMESPLNVQHLTLNATMHPNEFYGIKFFLKSCPFLESLTLNISPARVLSDYEPPFELDPNTFWTENIISFKCLRRTLKVVEVKGFTGGLNEIRFLCYLMFLGRRMEELNIYIAADTEHTEIVRGRAEQLNNFQLKASRNLQISIK